MSACPEKKSVSFAVLMSLVCSASPVPANADATPISAEKPEFDAAGFAIPYFSLPAFAAVAMSAQVTGFEPVQPSRVATDCFTPSTTGDSMIRSEASGRPVPPFRVSRLR